MLTDEEQDYLKQKLGCQLARIILDAHATVDAEIVLLCSKLDRMDGEQWQRMYGGDLSGWKKVINVELDMHVAEVLRALSRMKENTYGKCVQCYAELSFSELQSNPTEQICADCRVEHRQTQHN